MTTPASPETPAGPGPDGVGIVDSQATGPWGGVGRGRREYRRKVLDLPDTEGRSRTGPGTSTSTISRAIRGAGRTASRRGLVPGVTSPGIYVHRAVNRQHRPGHVRVRPPPSAPTAEDRRHRTPGGHALPRRRPRHHSRGIVVWSTDASLLAALV